MNIGRRGFLGLFGAGATIAPMLEGVILRGGEARIIEPPKVELVRPEAPKTYTDADMPPAFYSSLGEDIEMHVDFYNRKTGKSWSMRATTFVTRAEMSVIDVTTYSDQYRQYMPGPSVQKWDLSGQIVQHIK